MNKWFVVLTVIALASVGVLPCASGVASAQSTPEATGSSAPSLPAGFPLARGAYWVYEGTVKWTKDTDVIEETVTWKVEVMDLVQREHVTGFLVKGDVTDLAWYEAGAKPENHVIIQVGADKTYTATEDALTRLKDDQDALVDLVNDAALMLDMPLFKDKVFGDTQQITRPDRMYAWWVADEQPADLSGIKGAPAGLQGPKYVLSLITTADNQTLEFVPGLGITHYTYVHNGTTAEADVQLVEFHPGTPS